MKYMLCFDGSEDSKKALTTLARMLNESDDVTIYNCFQYTNNGGFYDIDVLDSPLRVTIPEEKMAMERKVLKERADGTLNDARDMLLKKIQLKMPPHLISQEVDDVREGILEFAEKNGIEVLVLGNRGLGRIKRLILGSVSSYVVQHAPQNCSVLVVK